MQRHVEVYLADGQTRVGAGLYEGLLAKSAGMFSAVLRLSPADLARGSYLLKFDDGGEWAVETLSEPGEMVEIGGATFGGIVTGSSHEKPPFD